MLIGYLFFDLVVCQDTDLSAPHPQGIDLGSESVPKMGMSWVSPFFGDGSPASFG